MDENQSERLILALERIAGALETISDLQAEASSGKRSFEALILAPEKSNGQIYWKVRGVGFMKYGVRIWPDALEAAGFTQLKDQNYELPAGEWRAWYLIRNGVAKKVTQLEYVGKSSKPAPPRPPAPPLGQF